MCSVLAMHQVMHVQLLSLKHSRFHLESSISKYYYIYFIIIITIIIIFIIIITIFYCCYYPI